MFTTLVSVARRMYREDGIAEEVLTRAILHRIEKIARSALDDEDHEAAVRRGELLTRDEAIELALSIAAD